MENKKQSFYDYWNSNPVERQNGVKYRQIVDSNGEEIPYVISDTGVIRRIDTNNILKTYHDKKSGYIKVKLMCLDPNTNEYKEKPF